MRPSKWMRYEFQIQIEYFITSEIGREACPHFLAERILPPPFDKDKMYSWEKGHQVFTQHNNIREKRNPIHYFIKVRLITFHPNHMNYFYNSWIVSSVEMQPETKLKQNLRK